MAVGQTARCVRLNPWLPSALNSGSDAPGARQKSGPNTALMPAPDWRRSP